MCRAVLALFSAVLMHAADPALTIEGVTGRDGMAVPAIQFTFAEFAALPHIQITVKEQTFEGVPVYELLKKAGQPFGEQLRKGQLVKYAVFYAHDGYRVLFALPEFDPAFTAARALVADRLNGKLLDAKKGPLWLVLPDEKTGARSVYMLERIELQSAPEPIR